MYSCFFFVWGLAMNNIVVLNTEHLHISTWYIAISDPQQAFVATFFLKVRVFEFGASKWRWLELRVPVFFGRTAWWGNSKHDMMAQLIQLTVWKYCNAAATQLLKLSFFLAPEKTTRRFRIATGLKLHWNTNLVTIEVMPSTIEQACIRMLRNFWLGESSGWWFLQAQVETWNSIRLIWPKPGRFGRFYQCSSSMSLHFSARIQSCKVQGWCQSSSDVWDGRLCAPWCCNWNVWRADHREDATGNRHILEIFSTTTVVQWQKPWSNFSRSTESWNCQ